MKYILLAGLFWSLLNINLLAQNNISVEKEPLTIHKALERAIGTNPGLRAADLESKAIQFEAEQLRAYPNPEIELEAENFLGNNEFSGLDGSEITLAASQTIVLAGKKNKLYQQGRVNKELSIIRYNLVKQELTQEVKKAFYSSLAFLKEIEKTDTLITLADSFVKNLDKRVKAGRISEAELSRAKIESELLKIRKSELLASYTSSQAKLKNLINADLSEEYELSGNLYIKNQFPSKEILLDGLKQNPAIQYAETEIKLQKAKTEVEKSLGVPDLNIRFGLKRDNGSGSEAFVVGAGIPVPLFDKNEKNIASSKVKTKIQEELLDKEIKNVHLKFHSLYQQAEALRERIVSLDKDILPKARQAYSIIEKGSSMGRYSILEVLDAQKSLFEIETTLIGYYKDLNAVIAELESLTQIEIKKEN